jgi:hypothetical protein
MNGKYLSLYVFFVLCFTFCEPKRTSTTNAETPNSCVASSSSVDSLILCLQNFIAENNTLTNDEWNAIQPTDDQRISWQQLIQNILLSNSNCDKIQIPTSLQGLYNLVLFTDSFTQYCLLYETNITNTTPPRFIKGWGIFMSRYNRNDVKINVHVSAAHPFSDEYVQNQAANVFVKTYANSLMISGVERDASLVNSTCEPTYGYRTDGAHENGTMFHTANYAIMTYQQSVGYNPTCAFIQFHGKASTTCPTDTIFLSNGFGTAPDSLAFYNNSNLPIQRLKMFLRSNMPDFTINTPLESDCDLTAGSNIFSRLVNGVHYGQECAIEPNPTNTTKGYFIHAEQAIAAREDPYYDAWSWSILQTFLTQKS